MQFSVMQCNALHCHEMNFNSAHSCHSLDTIEKIKSAKFFSMKYVYVTNNTFVLFNDKTMLMIIMASLHAMCFQRKLIVSNRVCLLHSISFRTTAQHIIESIGAQIIFIKDNGWFFGLGKFISLI